MNTSLIEATSSWQGWTASPDGRGTADILWTCFPVLLICNWTVVHPHISSPNSSWIHRVADRLVCLAIAMIAPEILVYLAFCEKLSAAELTESTSQEERLGPQWKSLHSFYALMGGFRIRLNRGGEATPTDYRLTADAVILLYRRGLVNWEQIPLHEEIEDRSKADWFIKGLAVFQASTFVIKSIGRVAQGLPITTLELTTLAYLPGMAALSFLWWHKPYDVTKATLLELKGNENGGRESASMTNDWLRSTSQLALPYEDFPLAMECIRSARFALGPINRWGGVAGLCFAVFGAIHCAAWSFEFATTGERWAWRASSLTISASVPLSWAITGVLRYFIVRYYKRKFSTVPASEVKAMMDEVAWKPLNRITRIVHGCGLALYAPARIYLLFEVFFGLRFLPSACYDSVEWSKYF